MTGIGRRVREIRENKGMTCTSLAEKVGLSTQGMWNLENGNVGRTYEKLPRIARALGCRIDDLFPEMDDVRAAEEGKTESEFGFDGETQDESLDGWAM